MIEILHSLKPQRDKTNDLRKMKIKSQDMNFLNLLAEYRILTVDQIEKLIGKGKRTIQKKLASLQTEGLINLTPRNFKAQRGRPENICSLTGHGVGVLRNGGLLPNDVPNNRVTISSIQNTEHEILLNWFRISLSKLSELNPDLETDFLSSTTPYLPLRKNGMPAISDSVNHNDQQFEFIPDGVFIISSKEQNKNLLFFLEVDMGTESITSLKNNSSCISQKIDNYKLYFISKKYKRYEKKWRTEFKGFRVLFLANTNKRRVSLSRFIASQSNADFIWISEKEELFKHGVGGNIWTRGGDVIANNESILGATLVINQPILTS